MVAQLQIILQKFKLIHSCADLQILSLLTKARSVCVMRKHFSGNRTLFPIAWVHFSPRERATEYATSVYNGAQTKGNGQRALQSNFTLEMTGLGKSLSRVNTSGMSPLTGPTKTL